MFSSEEVAQTTESLEQLPRTYDHKSAIAERRQQIIQQKSMEKQTDALPVLPVLTPDDTGALASTPLSTTSSVLSRATWRQITQLRDENRRLRIELEALRAQVQGGDSDKQEIQTHFDAQVTMIHNGYQQEIAHFHQHLQETLSERNQLQQLYQELTQQHQILTEKFQSAVEDTAQQHIRDITLTAATRPDETAPWLRQIMHQAGDRQLKEMLYLKRELKRITGALEEERQQLNEERQYLAAFQQSVREQAITRQKDLHSRLHARWRVASIATSIGLIALLVILQCVSLALFHVSVGTTLMVALATPIVICALLAFILASPLTFFKQLYASLPQRVRQQ